MAWGKKHTADQIVSLLRQIEVAIANGKTTAQASKEVLIAEQTYYRWRKEYGVLRVDPARRLGRYIVNRTAIPVLCRKAGVPEQDAQDSITSRGARPAISTRLYNAKQPMSLFALKEWLGHRRLESTQCSGTPR